MLLSTSQAVCINFAIFLSRQTHAHSATSMLYLSSPALLPEQNDAMLAQLLSLTRNYLLLSISASTVLPLHRPKFIIAFIVSFFANGVWVLSD